MSVLDSVVVGAFGLSIVFSVLIALSLVIKLITNIVGRMQKKESKTEEKLHEEEHVSLSNEAEVPYADGELKLFDVDEKTAALIMAIVSNKSNIPLSQLHFKSIRLMKQEA